MDENEALDALRLLTLAMREGRTAEVIMGLLHAMARLYQFVELVHETPDLGIVLLDQELSTLTGPADTPGARAALEALRAILAGTPRKPN